MSEPSSAPLPALSSHLAARLTGGAFVLLGAGFLYWQLYLPLARAAAHVERVNYSTQLIVVGEFTVLAGLHFVVRGASGLNWLRRAKDDRRLFWGMVGLCALLVFATRAFLAHQFAALGYGG